jgi:hypothetical protein
VFKQWRVVNSLEELADDCRTAIDAMSNGLTKLMIDKAVTSMKNRAAIARLKTNAAIFWPYIHISYLKQV